MSLVKILIETLSESNEKYLFDIYLKRSSAYDNYYKVLTFKDEVKKGNLDKHKDTIYKLSLKSLENRISFKIDTKRYIDETDEEYIKRLYFHNLDFREGLLKTIDIGVEEFLYDFRFILDTLQKNNILRKYVRWIFQKVIGKYFYVRTKNIFDTTALEHLINFEVRSFLRKRFEEDIDNISNYLETFEKYKKYRDWPQEYKDINKIDSYEKLVGLISKYEKPEGDTIYPRIQKYIDDGTIKEDIDYTLLGEDDKWIVVTPLTEKGACTFGAFSEWCTSFGKLALDRNKQTLTNAFKDYDSEWLITFINKNKSDESYQVDFASDQFMDYDDKPVSEKDLMTKLDGVALEVFKDKKEWYDGLN